MRRRAILVAGFLTLGACATRPATPDGGAVAGSPLPVAGLDWRLTLEDGAAKLAYGSEASDDLLLAFECVPGAARIDVMAPGAEGESELRLEAGGDVERLTARAEPLGVRDGVFLTASTEPGAPVLRRFRALGWIARWRGERREVLAAHPGTGADIGRFFDACDAG